MEFKYYLRGLGLGIAITAIIMGIATSKSKAMTNEEIIARAKQLGMIEDTTLAEIKTGKEDDEKNPEDAGAAGETDGESKQGGLPKAGTDGSMAASEADADNTGTDGSKQDTSAKADTGVDGSGTETGTAVSGDAADNNKLPDNAGAGTDGSKQDGSVKADAGSAASGQEARMTDSGTDAETGDTDTPVSGGSMVITIGKGDGSYSASQKLADVGAVPSAGEFDAFLCQNGYDKKIRAGTYTIPADASEEQMARIITGAE